MFYFSNTRNMLAVCQILTRHSCLAKFVRVSFVLSSVESLKQFTIHNWTKVNFKLKPQVKSRSNDRNILQHCRSSICKPRPNGRIISTQHIATLLGDGYVRLATLLRRVATCCELKIELVRMPSIIARAWPNDSIMKHPQMLSPGQTIATFQSNTSQHCHLCPIWHPNWVDSSEALEDSTRSAVLEASIRTTGSQDQWNIWYMIHEPSSFLKRGKLRPNDRNVWTQQIATLNKGGELLKKLWCFVGGSITR